MTEPEVSVVIPCYDRLALLERTLRACFSQAAAGIAWEIVVADNHPDRLAAPMLAGLNSPVPLRHVPAGERNIALARNRGVAAAKGSLIAFVDDDEAPEPGWLTAHVACLRRTGADASFGPKYPVFEGGRAPDWDPDGKFYTTDFDLPPDTEIRPLQWWPPQARGLGTGNSMLRRYTCLAGDTPFDEVFGRSGGEDSMLLLGLAKEGRRFMWCPDAKVIEFNEASRLSPAYMAARVRRSGRHSTAVRLAISDNKLLTRLGIGVVGLGQLGVYGALWMATRKARYGMSVAKGLGKLGFAEFDFVPERRPA
ncbi:glycosyltransferase family 2 protein [Acidisphaera sp. L21]|uniref:glycosyltransferase family 2 protein n=1 Tax=Acidisphaera sp. L21 TaxID=1641851 RepID=UPI00131AF179|nr:glycosyltransferase family 2 protein [Acidisphaera sp. L21]